jgi:hypothetical protein
MAKGSGLSLHDKDDDDELRWRRNNGKKMRRRRREDCNSSAPKVHLREATLPLFR